MARKRYWVLSIDELGRGLGGHKACIHEAPTCAGIGYPSNSEYVTQIDAWTRRKLLRQGHRDCKRCVGMK